MPLPCCKRRPENLILPDNQQKFCAWYNCDLFFFEAEKIKYLLFQEDILYRRSQVQT
jgi:hypothetical protein